MMMPCGKSLLSTHSTTLHGRGDQTAGRSCTGELSQELRNLDSPVCSLNYPKYRRRLAAQVCRVCLIAIKSSTTSKFKLVAYLRRFNHQILYDLLMCRRPDKPVEFGNGVLVINLGMVMA